jgi:hypothetical protein
MKADITGIITGTITSTSSLSSGADTANCAIYGNYPTGIYTVSNSGSSTYAKVHNAYNTYTHYIRMGWDGSTGLSSISLAQSYTSGTDTLVNSYSYSFGATLVPQTTQAIDIVVNTNCFYINAPSLGVSVGIFDIGHNGLTRTYTNSMLMVLQPIYQGNPSGVQPYTWSLITYAYGTLSNVSLVNVTPSKIPYNTAGNLAVMENPVFINSASTGYAINVVYGLNKINDDEYVGRSIYVDASSVYRYVLQTNTVCYSITIT